MTSPNPSQPKLLNVHEVLQDAFIESEAERTEWVTQSFRIPLPLKKMCEEICKSNGTDASKFLRKCCETLVRDYLPLKPNQE